MNDKVNKYFASTLELTNAANVGCTVSIGVAVGWIVVDAG